jgi:bile acid:Na+ symporter, BASS family
MSAAQFLLNKMMPIWLIVCGLVAYAAPQTFIAFSHFSIYYLAGVILLMSLTLTLEALKPVIAMPGPLIAGFVIKWVTVPLAAVIAAHVVYASQPQLAAGTILDGATPAGVTSSLFTFLANGAVALAIALTFVHTLVSPLLTPALASVFAHKYVHVDFFALLHQMLTMVLLPLVIGIFLRAALGPKRIAVIKPFLPMGSALLLYCLALGLVAAAEPAIAKNLIWIPIIAATTSLLCTINLAVGYFLSRALRLSEANARAIMFDAGVYNSGLGAVLATVNFGPFAALPALMNTLMNLVIGSMLATWLHGKPVEQDAAAPAPVSAPAAEAYADR